ncbi:MAG TPA: DUF1565 domain-containing protein, partial [Polyangiaceae bacterium]|nr:DUF1565 domain-containing protein [Polyangiaceae bacterium]
MRTLGVQVLLAFASLLGCGGDDTAETIAEATPVCAPLELSLPDGSCVRPGVPPDGCADGFVHDGEYGCSPILPEAPCPPGRIAVPGDTMCRPVMPCGAGKWGDIPVDGSTEYVDAAYTGVESDGSESRPWKTIGAAVAAAASNAIVAVARGSYVEDVAVSGKPVKLWGVCPDEVELVGTGVEDGALFIGAFASGSEVHGLAMRGAGLAVVHSGSEAVIFDRVWVHDAAWVGIYSDGQLGPTSFVMRGSLVESNHEYGVLVIDGEALVETSSVR